jgi:DNA-binding NtrC family response regulator
MGMTERESGMAAPADLPFKQAKNLLVGDFEKDYIVKLLERNGGNISRAAREAQIERAYLQRLVRKHEVNPKD